ncbi:Sensor histidine kinase YycG [Clostridium ljungdahlii]|uniref:histidine kinase n=2 Tax=Clostridium ljungdahlii TaxID=1538 RepID=A0A168NAP5_9CLOT|nr:Sensor histidine kinase YycG [Clostridium ljungdahlii]
MNNMSILNCVLIFIIIFLILILMSFYKKANYISIVIDQILNGNLNQRIRIQTHVKTLSKLIININRLIDELQKVQKKSNTSEESRKRMISNISHDLRTPLTSILGYIELLLNDTTLTLAEKERYIKIACSKGNYLYNLMEEFFQISKMDSNDFKLDVKEINICEIVRQNVLLFFNEFKKINIAPELNLEKDDVYAVADEKSLNRILANLINNALKYGSHATKIGIDLSCDNDNIFISVWDNGPGIPKEDLPYVFDRLYTVEKSRKLNLKSSGLGLTIVKKLVESLGGNIFVSSTPFERTEFKFTLKQNLRKL